VLVNVAQAIAAAILIPSAVVFLVRLQRQSLREYGVGVEDEPPPVRIPPIARCTGHFALAAKQAGYTVRIEHGGLDIRHPKAPRAKAFVRATGPRTVLLWRRGLDRHGQEVITPDERPHPCTYAEAGEFIGDWFRAAGR